MRAMPFYTVITHRAERTGVCPVCGRRVRRAKTFEQTVNPYHPAIMPGMTYLEACTAVRLAVEADARDWQPNFTHAACEAELNQ